MEVNRKAERCKNQAPDKERTDEGRICVNKNQETFQRTRKASV